MLKQTIVIHGLKSALKSLRESRSISTTSSQSFLQRFLNAKKPTKAVSESLSKKKNLFEARKNGWLIVNNSIFSSPKIKIKSMLMK